MALNSLTPLFHIHHRAKEEPRNLLQALVESMSQLERSQEEKQSLASMLLHAQEEERRRVSRELHDDLSQKLGKLQFDVETVYQRLPRDYQEIRDRMWLIRDQLANFSEDVRRIAHDLHPSILDHLGLVVALQSLAREFTSREKIPVRLVVTQVPEKLPLDVQSAVYRVVQEALRNVAKHAGKTTVDLKIAWRRSHLAVLIRDRGIGFDSRSVRSKGGLGLISMEERVRLVRGDFLLRTSPGRGVAILLRIPLSQEAC